MKEDKPNRFGRVLWSLLAVAALVAVTAGVLYVNRGGAPGAQQPSGNATDGDGDAATVGSETELATVNGTLFYIKYTENGSELWSWKPGEAPKSRYKTTKSKLASDARVSPDGRYLSFLVAGSEYPKNNLVVRDLQNNTERTIAKGLIQGGEFCMDATWAPDGRPMILTQTRINSAGSPVLRWFDVEAGTKSQEMAVNGCFARPVARGDDGFDLYYVDREKSDIVKRTPDGKTTATGIGPAVEASLGQPLLGLGDLDQDGSQACITVGDPNGPVGRVLDCKIVVDMAAKTVVYSPDGGFKGPVLFTADGGMLGRFSTFVSLMDADGAPIARADEPGALKTFYLLGYVAA